MNTSDERIKQLLREAVEHELGSRLDTPSPEDQLRGAGARPRRARWAIPLAAAAAVVVIAGGSLAIVEAVSGNRTTTPPGASTGAIQVECVGARGADVAKDVATLTSRAAGFAHGGHVTSTVSGRTVSITIPGAERPDATGLCTSTTLDLRPLVAPAVLDRSGTVHDPLARLTFPIPGSEAAYDRLTAKQQAALAAALRSDDCRPGAARSSAATVACDAGQASGAPIAALLGAPIVSGRQLAGASAQAPNSASGSTEWVVSVRFTAAGGRAFATYTSAHNSGGDSPSASTTSCGASSGTPCSDFIAFVVNGRIESLPITQQPIAGGNVQISGTFTEATAKALAVSLRSGQLPVPLRVGAITEVAPR